MTSDNETNPKKRTSTSRYVIYFTILVLVIACIIGVYWYGWGRYQDSTENAYVHGNKIEVSTQVPGIVTSVHTDNMRYVKKGQLLFQLDDTDYQLAYEKAYEHLEYTVRKVCKMFEQVVQMRADLLEAKSGLAKAKVDFENRARLVEEGAVSTEDYLHAKFHYQGMAEKVDSIHSQLAQALALVAGTHVATHPLVEHAAAQLREAFVNLNRCDVRAPVHGIVTQRKAQVGSRVHPDEDLLWIVPLDQIWVQANFREVDIAPLKIGQRVSVYSDIYGSDVLYHGTVSGIDGGSGAVLSLIPPQNATGNWIKIVQRIPVRVDLDPHEVARHPLRLGASMHVDVDIHNQYGPEIPAYCGDQAVYQTDIYETQEEGAQAVIDRVISENQRIPIHSLEGSEVEIEH